MTKLSGLLALLLMWLAPVSVHAQSCESLLAQIDAKIRAAGATNFTLMTVDADATDPGRVIGSCGMGRKKILYTSVGGMAGASLPAGATLANPTGGLPRPRPAAVLTECKEGYTGADCGQRKSVVPVEDKKPAP